MQMKYRKLGITSLKTEGNASRPAAQHDRRNETESTYCTGGGCLKLADHTTSWSKGFQFIQKRLAEKRRQSKSLTVT